MSHYECKNCHERYDDCKCKPVTPPTRVPDADFKPFSYGDIVTRDREFDVFKEACTPRGFDHLGLFRVTHVSADGRYIHVNGLTGTSWAASNFRLATKSMFTPTKDPEYTGGSSSYYKLEVQNPTSGGYPYKTECNDIIEALGMNFAEGNAFKAIWRRAAQRTLGLRKAGAKDDGLYDAEKVEFFGKRLVAQSKGLEANDSE